MIYVVALLILYYNLLSNDRCFDYIVSSRNWRCDKK